MNNVNIKKKLFNYYLFLTIVPILFVKYIRIISYWDFYSVVKFINKLLLIHISSKLMGTVPVSTFNLFIIS